MTEVDANFGSMFDNISDGSDSDDDIDTSLDINKQIVEPFHEMLRERSNNNDDALHSPEWTQARNIKLLESMLSLQNPEISQSMVDFLLQVCISKSSAQQYATLVSERQKRRAELRDIILVASLLAPRHNTRRFYPRFRSLFEQPFPLVAIALLSGGPYGMIEYAVWLPLRVFEQRTTTVSC